jgi:DNA-binding IclR family transcriptional regulator
MNDRSRKTDYTNSSQQRILKVVLTMFGHEIDGLPPGQLAKLAGITPGEATRDLDNLMQAGFVETVPQGNAYRISPMIGQRALAILNTIERASRRLEDTRNRYTRIPETATASELLSKFTHNA